jgi:translation initiation factor IF-2
LSKIRIYELAKQLNVSNKELIEKIETIGISVKNHMTGVEDEDKAKIINYFNPVGIKNKKAGESLIDENKQEQPNTKEAPEDNKLEVQKINDQNKNRSYSQNNNQNNNQNRNKYDNQSQNRVRRDNQGQTVNGQTNQTQNVNRQDSQGQYRPRPQASNTARPDGQNQGQYRPRREGQGQYSNRPDYQNRNTNGQGTTRPDGQNQGQYRPRPQGNNTGRPEGQNQGQYRQRPQGTSTGRPEGQNQGQYRPRPQGNNTGRPDGQNQGQYRPRPQGSNTGRPDGQNQGQYRQNDNRGNNFKKGPSLNSDKRDHKPAAPVENKKEPRNFNKENKSQFEQKNKLEQKENTRFYKNKNQRNQPKGAAVAEKPPVKEAEQIKVIEIAESITVKAFAEKMNQPVNHLIKFLLKQGVMDSLNQEIDFETASNIAVEFGYLVEQEKPEEEIDILESAFGHEEDKEEDKKERPPIVVVMGHVDHGKTSLLDSIRKSKVASSEAGGITQHIGAYTVSIDDKPITFLDTPGHEAFTAMRMRGAQVTDIAILVVAADDGVMPQTVEAINHAKAAGIDIIVAINKIDKPSANMDRVKQELVEYGLVAEDWGGETICVPVSAQTKQGIDNLLEMIILVSEMKELKANPNKKAKGTVIEALLDKGRGPVATVLVQEGTLKIGDPVVIGTAFGKVRAMVDDKGRKVKKAGPSTPVEILGLSEVPLAGDLLNVANSEKHARQISESFVKKGRIDMLKESTQKVSLDDLFTQIKQGNVKDLNIVVKADVQGSVEAVKASLERLSTDEVRIKSIHGGVGAITESDVMLASASNAVIIGFNVRPDNSAKKIAEDEKVDVRLYRVIYGAIEDIQAAIKGMLDPIYQEKVTGHAEVRQIFKASNIGNIAGSYVTDGKISRNAKVRILRDNIVVYEGTLDTLKRFKDDVKEVNTGYECGLFFNKYNDIKLGDVVEAYVMEEIPR